MELLIKITSEPIQMVRMSQGARLVSSGSADIERRKALARRMSFHRSYSSGAGSMPVEDIQRINRAFAKGQVSRTQSPTQPQQPAVQHRAPRPAARPVAQSVPAPQPSMADLAPSKSMLANMPSGMTVGTEAVLNETMAAAASTASTAPLSTAGTSYSAEIQDVSVETSSSYTTERGAFEMRVARGDLTYLPPMVMTIITQRPQVHVEYLGGFNYVPPSAGEVGGSLNLFT